MCTRFVSTGDVFGVQLVPNHSHDQSLDWLSVCSSTTGCDSMRYLQVTSMQPCVPGRPQWVSPTETNMVLKVRQARNPAPS